MNQGQRSQRTPPQAFLLRTLSEPCLLTSTGSELLGPGKPLALLVYLACSPRRSAGREHLIDLLWSDLPPERARHSLRQALWYLKKHIPDGIEGTGNEIRLTLEFRFDRDEFLDLIEQGRLEEAIALYQTDFLTDFGVPGGLEFEHWADVERQRLRSGFLLAVEQLTRRQLDAGQFRDAVALARRGRDMAVNSERTWRLLLEAVSAARDRVGFAAESSALRTRLTQEGRDPEPATLRLLRAIEPEGPTLVSGVSFSLDPDLVGRGQEFSRILRAWDETRSHHGSLLQLVAGPGLGKSRLLAEVQSRIRALGHRVVSVRATPGDRGIPFSLAAELACGLAKLPGSAAVSRESASTLVALHPALSGQYPVAPDPATGLEALRRRSGALKELLTVVADEQPYALLVDDLHWADGSSLRVIRSLMDRISHLPVLVLIATRPMAGSLDHAEVIPLTTLAPAQVTELLASLAPLPDESWSAELPLLLHAATGGVPLLILETLQASIERGSLMLAGAWACPSWVELRAELSEVSPWRQRVTGLEPEASKVLLGLAVAGNPLRVSEVAQVIGRDSVEVERQLNLLEQKGLCQRLGDQCQPAHDELASLALELASPERRREIHCALGRCLAGRVEGPLDLVRAGHHLAEAERWPEVRTVFLRYVRQVRREGDARRLRFLAGDFLEGLPDQQVHRLLASLGRLNRVLYELARPTVAAGLVGLSLVGAGAFAFTRPQPGDVTLTIWDPEAPVKSSLVMLPLSEREWAAGSPIDVSSMKRHATPGRLPRAQELLPSPDGKRWAVTVNAGGDYSTDVVMVDDHDRVTPLAIGIGDENAVGWLADGSEVLISTARWHPEDDFYDLGLQPLSGEALQLTDTPDHDISGVVSPEGSRIAFDRRSNTGESVPCLMETRGGEAHCLYQLALNTELIGWADSETLLVLRRTADGLARMMALNLNTGSSIELLDQLEGATVSPDGRWLSYCRLQPGRSIPAWFVARTEAPLASRELLGVKRLSRNRWLRDRRTSFLARVELVQPSRPLTMDAAFSLFARTLDQSGRPLDISIPLRWSSSDTLVATVDSTGLLHPRQPGRTMITVSVRGWRSDTATIELQPSLHRQLLDENWSEWRSRWVAYGRPEPVEVRTPEGNLALWNRGDGSYESGAYTRDAWNAEAGLGVEVLLKVPITSNHWQTGRLMLAPGLDSVALGAAHHEIGDIPIDQSRSCNISYPIGEGWSRADSMSLSAGGLNATAAVSSRGRSGQWMRVRLQFFPDGTCGVALDGQPLWRSRIPALLDRPLGVMVGSSSVGTQVLHGHLTVWSGVQSDIDWPSLGFQPR